MGASLSALAELPMLQSHDGAQPSALLSQFLAESMVLFFANMVFGGLVAAHRSHAELPWRVATCLRAPRTASVSEGSSSSGPALAEVVGTPLERWIVVSTSLTKQKPHRPWRSNVFRRQGNDLYCKDCTVSNGSQSR